ncbi:MAG: hypothetical protein FJX31_09150 [Alphaproteobacteria bacterium]|nr:hypothetical protein [Alphaproteobacteria bacterium]
MRDIRSLGLALAALAVAAAFLIRAALPLGWMPAQTEDGIRVLLCASDSSSGRTIELVLPKADRDAGDSGQHPDDLPRDPCPFGAALAKAFDLPAPLVVPEIPALSSPEVRLETITAWIVDGRAIRPPARGPPLSA